MSDYYFIYELPTTIEVKLYGSSALGAKLLWICCSHDLALSFAAKIAQKSHKMLTLPSQG